MNAEWRSHHIQAEQWSNRGRELGYAPAYFPRGERREATVVKGVAGGEGLALGLFTFDLSPFTPPQQQGMPEHTAIDFALSPGKMPGLLRSAMAGLPRCAPPVLLLVEPFLGFRHLAVSDYWWSAVSGCA
jgi:hypothetical protein